jgi:hypothetical protein
MRRLIHMGISIRSNANGFKGVRKHGALWRIESVSTLPERGGLGRTEEKEGEEREEKADNDAVEHRARARVTVARPAAGTGTATESIDPLLLECACVFLVCQRWRIVQLGEGQSWCREH